MTNEADYRKAIGERIMRARRLAGYTVRGLAKASGQDRAGIARWESGERSPRPYALARIAHACGVQVAELLPAIEDNSADTTEDNGDGIYDETGTPAGA